MNNTSSDILFAEIAALNVIEARHALEKGYSAFSSDLEAALSDFEKAQDWSDLISHLQRLQKVFENRKYSSYKFIPQERVSHLCRVLAQCLTRGLPSGVHSKALQLYSHIFERLDVDFFIRDLALYSIGLFPLLQHATEGVRPVLLDIFKKHYLPLNHQLAIVATSLIAAILPGLEDLTSEHYGPSLAVLGSVRSALGEYLFLQSAWQVVEASPSLRLAALEYLASLPAPQLTNIASGDGADAPHDPHASALAESAVANTAPQASHAADAASASTSLSVVPSVVPALPAPAAYQRVLLAALLASLADSNPLVVRAALDLMIQHAPLRPQHVAAPDATASQQTAKHDRRTSTSSVPADGQDGGAGDAGDAGAGSGAAVAAAASPARGQLLPVLSEEALRVLLRAVLALARSHHAPSASASTASSPAGSPGAHASATHAHACTDPAVERRIRAWLGTGCAATAAHGDIPAASSGAIPARARAGVGVMPAASPTASRSDAALTSPAPSPFLLRLLRAEVLAGLRECTERLYSLPGVQRNASEDGGSGADGRAGTGTCAGTSMGVGACAVAVDICESAPALPPASTAATPTPLGLGALATPAAYGDGSGASPLASSPAFLHTLLADTVPWVPALTFLTPYPLLLALDTASPATAATVTLTDAAAFLVAARALLPALTQPLATLEALVALRAFDTAPLLAALAQPAASYCWLVSVFAQLASAVKAAVVRDDALVKVHTRARAQAFRGAPDGRGDAPEDVLQSVEGADAAVALADGSGLDPLVASTASRASLSRLSGAVVGDAYVNYASGELLLLPAPHCLAADAAHHGAWAAEQHTSGGVCMLLPPHVARAVAVLEADAAHVHSAVSAQLQRLMLGPTGGHGAQQDGAGDVPEVPRLPAVATCLHALRSLCAALAAGLTSNAMECVASSAPGAPCYDAAVASPALARVCGMAQVLLRVLAFLSDLTPAGSHAVSVEALASEAGALTPLFGVRSVGKSVTSAVKVGGARAVEDGDDGSDGVAERCAALLTRTSLPAHVLAVVWLAAQGMARTHADSSLLAHTYPAQAPAPLLSLMLCAAHLHARLLSKAAHAPASLVALALARCGASVELGVGEGEGAVGLAGAPGLRVPSPAKVDHLALPASASASASPSSSSSAASSPSSSSSSSSSSLSPLPDMHLCLDADALIDFTARALALASPPTHTPCPPRSASTSVSASVSASALPVPTHAPLPPVAARALLLFLCALTGAQEAATTATGKPLRVPRNATRAQLPATPPTTTSTTTSTSTSTSATPSPITSTASTSSTSPSPLPPPTDANANTTPTRTPPPPSSSSPLDVAVHPHAAMARLFLALLPDIALPDEDAATYTDTTEVAVDAHASPPLPCVLRAVALSVLRRTYTHAPRAQTCPLLGPERMAALVAMLQDALGIAPSTGADTNTRNSAGVTASPAASPAGAASSSSALAPYAAALVARRMHLTLLCTPLLRALLQHTPGTPAAASPHPSSPSTPSSVAFPTALSLSPSLADTLVLVDVALSLHRYQAAAGTHALASIAACHARNAQHASTTATTPSARAFIPWLGPTSPTSSSATAATAATPPAPPALPSSTLASLLPLLLRLLASTTPQHPMHASAAARCAALLALCPHALLPALLSLALADDKTALVRVVARCLRRRTAAQPQARAPMTQQPEHHQGQPLLSRGRMCSVPASAATIDAVLGSLHAHLTHPLAHPSLYHCLLALPLAPQHLAAAIAALPLLLPRLAAIPQLAALAHTLTHTLPQCSATSFTAASLRSHTHESARARAPDSAASAGAGEHGAGVSGSTVGADGAGSAFLALLSPPATPSLAACSSAAPAPSSPALPSPSYSPLSAAVAAAGRVLSLWLASAAVQHHCFLDDTRAHALPAAPHATHSALSPSRAGLCGPCLCNAMAALGATTTAEVRVACTCAGAAAAAPAALREWVRGLLASGEAAHTPRSQLHRPSSSALAAAFPSPLSTAVDAALELLLPLLRDRRALRSPSLDDLAALTSPDAVARECAALRAAVASIEDGAAQGPPADVDEDVSVCVAEVDVDTGVAVRLPDGDAHARARQGSTRATRTASSGGATASTPVPSRSAPATPLASADTDWENVVPALPLEDVPETDPATAAVDGADAQGERGSRSMHVREWDPDARAAGLGAHGPPPPSSSLPLPATSALASPATSVPATVTPSAAYADWIARDTSLADSLSGHSIPAGTVTDTVADTAVFGADGVATSPVTLLLVGPTALRAASPLLEAGDARHTRDDTGASPSALNDIFSDPTATSATSAPSPALVAVRLLGLLAHLSSPALALAAIADCSAAPLAALVRDALSAPALALVGIGAETPTPTPVSAGVPATTPPPHTTPAPAAPATLPALVACSSLAPHALPLLPRSHVDMAALALAAVAALMPSTHTVIDTSAPTTATTAEDAAPALPCSPSSSSHMSSTATTTTDADTSSQVYLARAPADAAAAHVASVTALASSATAALAALLARCPQLPVAPAMPVLCWEDKRAAAVVRAGLPSTAGSAGADSTASTPATATAAASDPAAVGSGGSGVVGVDDGAHGDLFLPSRLPSLATHTATQSMLLAPARTFASQRRGQHASGGGAHDAAHAQAQGQLGGHDTQNDSPHSPSPFASLSSLPSPSSSSSCLSPTALAALASLSPSLLPALRSLALPDALAPMLLALTQHHTSTRKHAMVVACAVAQSPQLWDPASDAHASTAQTASASASTSASEGVRPGSLLLRAHAAIAVAFLDDHTAPAHISVSPPSLSPSSSPSSSHPPAGRCARQRSLLAHTLAAATFDASVMAVSPALMLHLPLPPSLTLPIAPLPLPAPSHSSLPAASSTSSSSSALSSTDVPPAGMPVAPYRVPLAVAEAAGACAGFAQAPCEGAWAWDTMLQCVLADVALLVLAARQPVAPQTSPLSSSSPHAASAFPWTLTRARALTHAHALSSRAQVSLAHTLALLPALLPATGAAAPATLPLLLLPLLACIQTLTTLAHRTLWPRGAALFPWPAATEPPRHAHALPAADTSLVDLAAACAALVFGALPVGVHGDVGVEGACVLDATAMLHAATSSSPSRAHTLAHPAASTSTSAPFPAYRDHTAPPALPVPSLAHLPLLAAAQRTVLALRGPHARAHPSLPLPSLLRALQLLPAIAPLVLAVRAILHYTAVPTAPLPVASLDDTAPEPASTAAKPVHRCSLHAPTPVALPPHPAHVDASLLSLWSPARAHLPVSPLSAMAPPPNACLCGQHAADARKPQRAATPDDAHSLAAIGASLSGVHARLRSFHQHSTPPTPSLALAHPRTHTHPPRAASHIPSSLPLSAARYGSLEAPHAPAPAAAFSAVVLAAQPPLALASLRLRTRDVDRLAAMALPPAALPLAHLPRSPRMIRHFVRPVAAAAPAAGSGGLLSWMFGKPRADAAAGAVAEAPTPVVLCLCGVGARAEAEGGVVDAARRNVLSLVEHVSATLLAACLLPVALHRHVRVDATATTAPSSDAAPVTASPHAPTALPDGGGGDGGAVAVYAAFLATASPLLATTHAQQHHHHHHQHAPPPALHPSEHVRVPTPASLVAPTLSRYSRLVLALRHTAMASLAPLARAFPRTVTAALARSWTRVSLAPTLAPVLQPTHTRPASSVTAAQATAQATAATELVNTSAASSSFATSALSSFPSADALPPASPSSPSTSSPRPLADTTGSPLAASLSPAHALILHAAAATIGTVPFTTALLQHVARAHTLGRLMPPRRPSRAAAAGNALHTSASTSGGASPASTQTDAAAASSHDRASHDRASRSSLALSTAHVPFAYGDDGLLYPVPLSAAAHTLAAPYHTHAALACPLLVATRTCTHAHVASSVHCRQCYLSLPTPTPAHAEAPPNTPATDMAELQLLHHMAFCAVSFLAPLAAAEGDFSADTHASIAALVEPATAPDVTLMWPLLALAQEAVVPAAATPNTAAVGGDDAARASPLAASPHAREAQRALNTLAAAGGTTPASATAHALLLPHLLAFLRAVQGSGAVLPLTNALALTTLLFTVHCKRSVAATLTPAALVHARTTAMRALADAHAHAQSQRDAHAYEYQPHSTAYATAATATALVLGGYALQRQYGAAGHSYPYSADSPMVSSPADASCWPLCARSGASCPSPRCPSRALHPATVTARVRLSELFAVVAEATPEAAADALLACRAADTAAVAAFVSKAASSPVPQHLAQLQAVAEALTAALADAAVAAAPPVPATAAALTATFPSAISGGGAGGGADAVRMHSHPDTPPLLRLPDLCLAQLPPALPLYALYALPGHLLPTAPLPRPAQAHPAQPLAAHARHPPPSASTVPQPSAWVAAQSRYAHALLPAATAAASTPTLVPAHSHAPSTLPSARALAAHMWSAPVLAPASSLALATLAACLPVLVDCIALPPPAQHRPSAAAAMVHPEAMLATAAAAIKATTARAPLFPPPADAQPAPTAETAVPTASAITLATLSAALATHVDASPPALSQVAVDAARARAITLVSTPLATVMHVFTTLPHTPAAVPPSPAPPTSLFLPAYWSFTAHLLATLAAPPFAFISKRWRGPLTTALEQAQLSALPPAALLTMRPALAQLRAVPPAAPQLCLSLGYYHTAANAVDALETVTVASDRSPFPSLATLGSDPLTLARELRATALTLWASRSGQWMRHAAHISARVSAALRQPLLPTSSHVTTGAAAGAVRMHAEGLLLARAMVLRLDGEVWQPMLPACLAAIVTHARAAGPHTLERAVATIHGGGAANAAAAAVAVPTQSPGFRGLLLSGLKFLELCAARAPDVFLPYRELFAPAVPATHAHPALSKGGPSSSAAATALMSIYNALYACPCPSCQRTPHAAGSVAFASRSKGSAHLASALLPLLERPEGKPGAMSTKCEQDATPQLHVADDCCGCDIVNATVALCSYAPFEWRESLAVRWGSIRATTPKISTISDLEYVLRAVTCSDSLMTANDAIDVGEALLLQDLCSQ